MYKRNDRAFEFTCPIPQGKSLIWYFIETLKERGFTIDPLGKTAYVREQELKSLVFSSEQTSNDKLLEARKENGIRIYHLEEPSTLFSILVELDGSEVKLPDDLGIGPGIMCPSDGF